MKTSFIIGIALTIALIVLMAFELVLPLGIIAFVIIGFQAYTGYYYEGKRSACHAFIGPVLLAAMLVLKTSPTIAMLAGLAWIASTVYLGYKAEID